MEKTIRIECDVKDFLPLDSMENFQGELKSLSKEDYAKLRREIIETGFAFPVYVWKSPESVNFIVGGHQRVRTLKEMRNEGFEIPPVPIVRVNADNFQQAKRRVLQDVAQFGKVESQGLYEFMSASDLSIGDLSESFRLPDLDMESFKVEYFEDYQPETVKEVNKGDENSEWVDMPEFEKSDDSFKLTFVFKTELERELYVKEKDIIIDRKMNNQWTVHK